MLNFDIWLRIFQINYNEMDRHKGTKANSALKYKLHAFQNIKN